MSCTQLADATTLSFEGDFEQQMNGILEQVRLTRQEVEDLAVLFRDLQYVLEKYGWPGCQVMPFGSIVSGMGIRSSDVDCYVWLPQHQTHPIPPNQTPEVCVRRARNLLNRNPHIFTDVYAIPQAKVPIVKFLHIPTQRHCDVNFKSVSGVRNSSLMAFLLNLDKRVFKLAVFLKYWSKVHRLTGTNLMPTYALSLLVIFYCQQLKILPPVELLQRHIPQDLVDNWNTAYNNVMNYKSDDNITMYELMNDFFKFYSKFNFETDIVCVYTGNIIKKEVFKSLDTVPDVFSLYKANVSSGICNDLRTNTLLCIQDPFELSRNCSCGVGLKLAVNIISYFKRCAQLFDLTSSENVLKAILSINSKSIKVINSEVLKETDSDPNKGRTDPVRTIEVQNKVKKRKNKQNRKLKYGLHMMYMKMNQMK